MAVPVTKTTITTKPIIHQTIAASTSSSQTHTTHSLKAPTQPSLGTQSLQEVSSSSSQSETQQPKPQSQSSSSSAQPKSSSVEKPPIKQKPAPPPRAPTTTKTSVGPTTAQQQQAQREQQHQHHHHHQHYQQGSKQTVSCGLCGADVGLGPGEARSSRRSSPAPDSDKSDHSEKSGKKSKIGIEKQESQDIESPAWKQKDLTR